MGRAASPGPPFQLPDRSTPPDGIILLTPLQKKKISKAGLSSLTCKQTAKKANIQDKAYYY